nr:reverse transcriptase domain-containing protein [Tanacetum cinerariifolium]
MRTQSAGWPAAKSLGGGTGVRVGRGRRGRRPREGNDERVDDLNGQGNDQGMGANGGVKGVNGNVKGANGGSPDFSMIIAQQLQNLLPENIKNVLVNGNHVGCSYKEFLACNPKEYDGKVGSIVLTRWIEKMESVRDMSGCSTDQKVKYTTGLFVGKALMWWNSQIRTLSQEVAASHATYTDRFYELARLVPHLVTPGSCSYKEFLACNPKEYDGKVGSVVLTRWIEKMESVRDMSGCSTDQKVKYTTGSFVGKALMWWNSQIRMLSQEVALESKLWIHAMVEAGHATYTDRFYELARLVPHLVTPGSMMIERYAYGLASQICGTVAAMEPRLYKRLCKFLVH